MAGTVGNTTIGISTNVETNGLERAQEQLNKLIELAKKAENPIKIKSEMGGISHLNDAVAKVSESVTKLNERMKLGNGNSAFKEMAVGSSELQKRLQESTEYAKKFNAELRSTRDGRNAWTEQERANKAYNNSLKQTIDLQKKQEQLSQSQQRSSGMLSRQNDQHQIAEQRQAINEERLKQAQMRSQAMMTPVPSGHGGGHGGEDWRWRSKLKGGIAETAGMYSLGMMGASAIMGAGEKVKELFGAGYEYTKEQSGMKGTWQTLVDGARGEGVSAKNAGSWRGITGAINDQSIRYGRSLELTNESYQQMYHATENADQTKHMVQSELRIADAMGLTDDQAKHMITFGIGHALELGKVTGGNLNQMQMYAPAMSGALARAVVANREGKDLKDVSEHDVEKEKTNLRSEIKKGKVNAKMLQEAVNYLGDVKFKNAAENAMKTIPGMTRAIENGAPRMMSAFEKSFAKPLEKTMGGGMYKLSKWFTDGGAEKAASNLGTKLGDITTKFYDAGKAIAPLAKQFGSGFGKGFSDVFKTVQKGFDAASDVFNKFQSKMGKNSPLGEIVKQAGKLAGMATAITSVGMVMRHIPIIGDTVNKLFGKLPIIGNLFKTNTTAGGKMMTAANTMMSAANKMNGGSSGSGGIGGGGAVSGDKLTFGQRLANSGLGRTIDKMFLHGASLSEKGGIRGLLGKALMGGSTLLGKGGLGGAKLLESIAGGRFGSLFKGIGSIAKRGGFGLNALFAGFDIAGTLASTKSGSQARHRGIGNAVGSGVGGTLGAALGSFLGPVGTVAGGVVGGWAGGKAGDFVGKHWDSIAKGVGKARNAISDFGKTLQNIPGMQLFGHALDTMMHPIKNFKRAIDDIKHPMQGLKDMFKSSNFNALIHPIETVQKAAKGLAKTISDITGKNVHLPKWLTTNPFKNFKFKNPFKDFKNPFKDFKNPFKNWKITNPFKGFKNPFKNLKNPFKDWKLTNPFKGMKLPKWLTTNPFKNFKLKNPFDNIKLPKWATTNPFKNFKLTNPFKNIHVPSWVTNLFGGGGSKSGGGKSSGPSRPSVAKSGLFDGFKGFKLPKMPKLPKWLTTNPFKNWKMPKIKMPKFKFPNMKLKNPFKDFGKTIQSSLNKAASNARSGANKIGNAVKSGLNKASNVARSPMNKIANAIKSGLNKSVSVARSSSSKIGNAIKSGLNKSSSSVRGSMNKISSAIRSGLNKSVSVARSSSNKIGNAIKSGLNKSANGVRSSMNRVSSAIRSGLSKSASVARSSSNKIANAIKSGMSRASSAASSGSNKIASSMKSGMSKVSSAVKSGMDKATSAMKSSMSRMVSVAQSATSKVASSFSKIGSSANSASSKVKQLSSAINSLKSKTVTLTVNMTGKGADKGNLPHFASGTKGTMGGLAVVNDGLSSNWREMFRLPNGMTGLFPNKKNLTVSLPKGTQIFNGEETAKATKIPHYAKGTGAKVKTGGVTVNIQSINVNGGDSKTVATDLVKQIKEEMQRAFANQLDLI